MRLLNVYVAFWPPSQRVSWDLFGHVEVFGYTRDETWVFIDPRQHRTEIAVTHHHDEVNELLAHRFANAEVWRLPPPDGTLGRLPLLGIFTCVSVAASVCGVRAYTIPGLRRKLRQIGAERVKHEAEGEPGGQEGAPA